MRVYVCVCVCVCMCVYVGGGGRGVVGEGKVENFKKFLRGATTNVLKKNKICRGDGIFLIDSLQSVMVSDIAFGKSSLENLLLKVVILDTSKHWSYHTGLLVLVFCVKFRLLSVCEYVN